MPSTAARHAAAAASTGQLSASAASDPSDLHVEGFAAVVAVVVAAADAVVSVAFVADIALCQTSILLCLKRAEASHISILEILHLQ